MKKILNLRKIIILIIFFVIELFLTLAFTDFLQMFQFW